MAIGLGVGYRLVVERLITSVAPMQTRTSPAAHSRVAGGTAGLSWGAALALVTLYGVITTTISPLVFRTRDILA
jgi:hypothetical protein